MDFLSLLFRILGILSIPLIIFSVYLMVRSIGRARRITQRSLVIQLCTSPAVLLIYALILGISISLKWAIPIGLLGLGIGGITASSTALSLRRSNVYGTRSTWYVLLWGASFVLTQTLVVFASSGLAAGGLATMYFSTGVAAGTNVSLLLRRRQLLASGVGGESLA